MGPAPARLGSARAATRFLEEGAARLAFGPPAADRPSTPAPANPQWGARRRDTRAPLCCRFEGDGAQRERDIVHAAARCAAGAAAQVHGRGGSAGWLRGR